MNRKKFYYALGVGVISLFVGVGIVYAATMRNITATLGGVAGDQFKLDGSLQVNSLKVGAQGTGGVTYFNGTIVNNTTGTGGTDNPVTFGDNVRIDGRLYRGSTAGTSDTLPLIVNDNMEVAGSLTAASLSADSLTVASLSADSLTLAGTSIPVKTVITGSFDVNADGDIIKNATGLTVDCNQIPMGMKSLKYHYKKVAVPALDVDAMPLIRTYVRNSATPPTNSPYPEDGSLWTDANTFYYQDGYVYIYYKAVYEYCNAPSATTITHTGDYKIVMMQ